MALSSENFDFISNFNSLWPIVLGALLATMGGLAGGQLEAFFERRKREKDAALFFGEVLSTLKILLDLASDSSKIGDPYGPITTRMLVSARREIDIYERNRENLYSLSHGDLRARIHTAILRLTMPLDGVFDAATAIESISAQLRQPNLSSADRTELEARIASIKATRDTSFHFAVETGNELKKLADDLGLLSGRDSASIERAVRSAT
jgi:hypothetical protein